jgi:hypothetical protein
MSNPLIQIIPTITSEEVTELNNFLETNGDPRITNTVFGATGYSQNSSVRSSAGFSLAEGNRFTEMVGQAMNKALLEYQERLCKAHPALSNNLAPGAVGTSSHREAIQILEYTPGQEYRYHFDMNWNRKEETYYRTVSVILYLTSDFEGGGTEFCDGVYKPNPGEALVFPSSWSFPHCGQKVTSGMKRVAVTWYYVYPTSPV